MSVRTWFQSYFGDINSSAFFRLSSILGVLMTKSIEPRIDVEELERASVA